MFNKAEREQMIREFFYAEDDNELKYTIPYLTNMEREDLHDYNLDYLYSSASDDLKNHSTRSLILAPKNSTEEEGKIPVDGAAQEALIRE